MPAIRAVIRRTTLLLLLGLLSLSGCGRKNPRPPVLPLKILVTSLPDAVRDKDYNTSINVEGGRLPYTWRVNVGVLPAGLTLGDKTGFLTGKPTALGSETFTIEVTDAKKPPERAAQEFTLNVREPLVIATDTLAEATVGVPYSVQFDQTGGTGAVTWSTSLLGLPAGLTLEANGLLSGIPLVEGERNIVAQATDSGSPPQTATKTLPLNILAGQPGVVARASLDPLGAEADAASTNPKMGTDELRVVYESAATNLVSGDGNGASDIFHFDLRTNANTRLSVTAVGGEANGASRNPAITGALTTLAFESDASNLTTSDTNPASDTYIRLLTGSTTGLVSLRSDGTQASGASLQPAVSDDGRFVAFLSEATDLVPGDTNGVRDVFLRDRSAGTTARISVGPGGAEATSPTGGVAISSSNPVAVVFESSATGLTAAPTNGTPHIFLHESGTNTLVSTSVQLPNTTPDIFGPDSIGRSDLQMVNNEHAGRRVRIASGAGAGQERLITANTATMLVVTPLWDTAPNATSVFRVLSEGDGASTAAALSADGRLVAFASLATNLLGAGYDTNTERDIYVHDRQTGRAVRVSVVLQVENQTADIFSPTTIGKTSLTLTPDAHVGQLVEIAVGAGAGQVRRVVTNDATTFTVDAPWNPFPDGTSVFRVVTEANGPSFTPSISADGRFVAFQSLATNLIPGDMNGVADIFVHDRQTGVTLRVSLNRDGTQADGPSRLPTLNRNGRWCAFVSEATNLLPTPDTNGLPDVYLAFTTMPVQ